MKNSEAIVYIKYDGYNFQKKNRMLKKSIINYCKGKGYKIIGLYSDNKLSRKSKIGRTRMFNVIKEIEKPTVVTKSFSMLSRDLDTTLYIFNEIKKESFKLDTMDGSFYNGGNKQWLKLSMQ